MFKTKELLPMDCFFSRACDEQKSKGKDEGDEEFCEWYTKHFQNCPRNFSGASQAMEAEGVSRIFERFFYTHILSNIFMNPCFLLDSRCNNTNMTDYISF